MRTTLDGDAVDVDRAHARRGWRSSLGRTLTIITSIATAPARMASESAMR